MVKKSKTDEWYNFHINDILPKDEINAAEKQQKADEREKEKEKERHRT